MSIDMQQWCQQQGGMWDAEQKRCLRTVNEETGWAKKSNPVIRNLAERVGRHSEELQALRSQLQQLPAAEALAAASRAEAALAEIERQVSRVNERLNENLADEMMTIVEPSVRAVIDALTPQLRKDFAGKVFILQGHDDWAESWSVGPAFTNLDKALAFGDSWNWQHVRLLVRGLDDAENVYDEIEIR